MKPKFILRIVGCAFMFSFAFYLMAFGGAMLCCSPQQTSWLPESFSYGLLALVIGAAIFLFALGLWARSFARRRNMWLTGLFLGTSVIVGDVVLFLRHREHLDDEIKLTWSGESGTFSWGRGEVTLPAGFSHKRDRGIDTFIGHFTSRDGKLVITHDIGELAGEHGGMGESETLRQGSRVRVGLSIRSDTKQGATYFSKVSFPDSGCANFYLESNAEQDKEAIEFIARTFRPKGWTPAWMWPMLPEVLRRDCRFRLRLPDVF